MSTSVLAALVCSTIGLAASTAAVAQPQLTVEDPDGGAPGDHFTDLTLSPGAASSSTLVVSQNTGSPTEVGVRLEPLTEEVTALHEQAALTLEGPDEVVSAPVGELLDSESAVWLGVLPSDEKTDLRLAVRLPPDAGNDTQEESVAFRVIVTARELPQDGNPPPESPEPSESPRPSPSQTDDPEDPSPSPDPSATSEPEPSNDPSPDPDEDLPRTGTEIVLLAVVAAVLAGVGAVALRVSRRRS